MRIRFSRLWPVAALLVVTQAGCPPPEGWPRPVFDTTGSYSGTWSGQSTDPQAPQNVVKCPLTLTLTQDLNAGYPGDHAVQGTVVVDYSCIELPEWADTPPPSTVNVGGILADDGTLTLLSGGCGTGMCVVLSLAGAGEDSDDDGYMDRYTGTWSWSLLLAGVQPLTLQGSYELTAD